MIIRSVDATWLSVPIPTERQHVSDFGRVTSFVPAPCTQTGTSSIRAELTGHDAGQRRAGGANDDGHDVASGSGVLKLMIGMFAARTSSTTFTRLPGSGLVETIPADFAAIAARTAS